MLHVAFVRERARTRAPARDRHRPPPRQPASSPSSQATIPTSRGHGVRARVGAAGYVETEQPVLAWPEGALLRRGASPPWSPPIDTWRRTLRRSCAVEYEPRPAVVDFWRTRARARRRPRARRPTTSLPLAPRSSKATSRRALASAAVVIERTFRTNRQAAAPLEGRGGVADWNAAEGKLTLYSGTQVPHLARHALGEILRLPENRVRVVAPDVGGGFGVKAIVYPEDVVLCLLAMRLERPVKWVETRREGFMGSAHARDHRYAVRAGFDAAGRLIAMDVRADCNAGAYSVYPWTAGIEA